MASKKMHKHIEKQSFLKSLAKNVSALLIFLAIPFFAYRSCTSGYEKYAFYVHVSDEAIFETQLDPADARILDRGRQLKDEIIMMDNNIDNGDGSNAGRLRWYICSGIDCDEEWEKSFLSAQ